MNHQSDPDALRTLYVGAVSVIVTIVVIIALQAVFYQAQESEITRKSSASEALAALRTEQLELLGSYRWVDRSKGTVAISVDRAMQLVVDELAADSSRPPIQVRGTVR